MEAVVSVIWKERWIWIILAKGFFEEQTRLLDRLKWLWLIQVVPNLTCSKITVLINMQNSYVRLAHLWVSNSDWTAQSSLSDLTFWNGPLIFKTTQLQALLMICFRVLILHDNSCSWPLLSTLSQNEWVKPFCSEITDSYFSKHNVCITFRFVWGSNFYSGFFLHTVPKLCATCFSAYLHSND